MKKLIILLLVIGVAAPAAWGLYSNRETAPARPDSAVKNGTPDADRDWPLLRELQRVNDWGVGLKNRLNAYLRRENRAARVANLKKCYPAIGGGLIAKHTTLRPGGPGDVVGEIVNTGQRELESATILVRLYDKAGTLLGSARAEVEGLKHGASKPFRAVVSKFPLNRVSRVALSYLPPQQPARP